MIPWREEGLWLWRHLPHKRCTGEILSTAPGAGSFQEGRKELPPYLREFWHLAVRRVALEQYDVVFAWEMRTALAVALLRRMRPKNRRSRFVAVGPILKGPILRVLPFVRWLLSETDRIICFSQAECERQTKMLGLPRSRFIFIPTAWETEVAATGDGAFILALGHSGRDYPTLLEAIRGTDLPLVIAAKKTADLGRAVVPPNVTVRYRTETDETNRLVTEAAMQVIPLADTGHSAGQSVLLRAMAHGQAVVVTETDGTRDYVRDNETAVLVPPGDVAALRAAIVRLWSDPAERQRIGKNAARIQRQEFSFERFARSLVAVAEDLAQGSPPRR